MGGKKRDIVVRLLEGSGQETKHVAKSLARFDAGKAKCFLTRDRQRLLAVAQRHYNRKTRSLTFACNRYPERARNKAELREKFRLLVADARENAQAHAAAPDSELPLACRSRPWLTRDPRAYRGHSKYRRGQRPQGKGRRLGTHSRP